MEFSEAVRIVTKAINTPRDLTDIEALNLGVAQMMLARQYVVDHALD